MEYQIQAQVLTFIAISWFQSTPSKDLVLLRLTGLLNKSQFSVQTIVWPAQLLLVIASLVLKIKDKNSIF